MEINPFLKLILNHLRYGNKVLNNFYMIYSYRHTVSSKDLTEHSQLFVVIVHKAVSLKYSMLCLFRNSRTMKQLCCFPMRKISRRNKWTNQEYNHQRKIF